MRAEKVVQSFEVNDKGMPDKGFQEMYEIQEELARLETDITNSLSGMREEYQSSFTDNPHETYADHPLRNPCHPTALHAIRH